MMAQHKKKHILIRYINELSNDQANALWLELQQLQEQFVSEDYKEDFPHLNKTLTDVREHMIEEENDD